MSLKGRPRLSSPRAANHLGHCSRRYWLTYIIALSSSMPGRMAALGFHAADPGSTQY